MSVCGHDQVTIEKHAPIDRSIEIGCTLPSFYKLFSLAKIYRCSFFELLGLYGIEIDTRTGLPVKANRLDPAR